MEVRLITATLIQSSSESASYFLSSEVFNETFLGLDSSSVSSEPYIVALCNVSAKDLLENGVIPGKPFNIGVVAAGQRSGISPATITAEVADGYPDIFITQLSHQTSTRECANISLVVQTTHVESTLSFH